MSYGFFPYCPALPRNLLTFTSLCEFSTPYPRLRSVPVLYETNFSSARSAGGSEDFGLVTQLFLPSLFLSLVHLTIDRFESTAMDTIDQFTLADILDELSNSMRNFSQQLSSDVQIGRTLGTS